MSAAVVQGRALFRSPGRLHAPIRNIIYHLGESLEQITGFTSLGHPYDGP